MQKDIVRAAAVVLASNRYKIDQTLLILYYPFLSGATLAGTGQDLVECGRGYCLGDNMPSVYVEGAESRKGENDMCLITAVPPPV